MGWWARAVVVATTATVTCAVGACKGATEVKLEIRTNANCNDPATWKGVAVYVGKPGDDVESKAPAFTTSACSGGEVGSVYITPSGAKDDDLGIRVVAGLSRKPEECRTANYDGCIVARRAVRFEPSQTLSIVVDLNTDCTGRACDSTHSCYYGACVESLGPTLVAPAPSLAPDSGASALPSGPTVRCGDNRAMCGTSGSVCCVTTKEDGTTQGDCMAPEACPSTAAVLYCDQDSDCASKTKNPSDPFVCCLAGANGYCNFAGARVSGAECVPVSECRGRTAVTLCEDRAPCTDNATCEPADIPGYFSCCIYKKP